VVANKSNPASRTLIAGAALALAMGGGQMAIASDASAPPTPAPGIMPAKAAAPSDIKWEDMTKEQRGKYMKDVVTPKMKPVFQEFDAKMFKKFDCASCHGKEFKARKFKMPNPVIHPLPSTPAAFQARMAKEPTWPKWVEFMAKKVEPQMAALLSMPAYDPKKPDPKAFGCKDCHTLSKE
jgi:hypothetical protein